MRSSHLKPMPRLGLVLGATLGLFAILASVLLATNRLTDAPKAPWLARNVIYPAYPAPVTQVGSQTTRGGKARPPSPTELRNRAASYERLVLGSHPLAYWPLGDHGSKMVDATGRHDGLQATRAYPGASGSSTLYNGRTDFSSVSGVGASANRQLTVEFWARNQDLNRRAFMVTKAAGVTTRDSEWWFEWRADDRIAFGLWNSKLKFSQALSGISYSSGWHQIIGVYDGSTLSLYVDGALAARSPQKGPIHRAGQPIVLGNLESTPEPLAFKGALRDVAVYARALTTAEIRRHFLAGGEDVRTFAADTVSWQLYPASWRAHAKWQISFPPGAVVQAVFVGGHPLKPTVRDLQTTYLPERPLNGPMYSVPNEAVGDKTNLRVVGARAPATVAPSMTLFMTRGPASTPGNASGVTGGPVVAWWETHLWVVIPLALCAYLLFALMSVWSFQQLRSLGLDRRHWITLFAVLGLEIVLSAVTTNLDIQIFKGEGERYWLYGPVPGLTLSGYGPIIDGLFVLPMLPYLLLTKLSGVSSEFALNLALRVPMIVGSLFMVGATARLARVVKIDERAKKIAFYGLLLNPLVIEWTLWHPEALVAGVLVFSAALAFENRPVAGGLMFGLAVATKYWPLFAGPFLLVYLWRARGKLAALQWLTTGVAVSLGLFLSYWAPAYISLGSSSEFIRLLHQRLPYFGGSTASSYSTIWSFYSLPRVALRWASFGSLLSNIEGYSFLIVVCLFAIILGLFIAGRPTKPRTLVAIGAVLALVASINSLSVAGFALWSLPFLIVGTPFISKARWMVAVAVAAWSSAVLVTVFIEPDTYWFLHTSPALTRFGMNASAWIQAHVINVQLAQAFGFLFCFCLALIGMLLVLEVTISTTWLTGGAPWHPEIKKSRFSRRGRGLFSREERDRV